MEGLLNFGSDNTLLGLMQLKIWSNLMLAIPFFKSFLDLSKGVSKKHVYFLVNKGVHYLLPGVC